MSCAAVFVDAGYLFAQGAAALTGSKKPRIELKLNETAAVAELMAVANARTGATRILRIYWYDATHQTRGMSLEHSALAHTDYIKLRLGHLNSQGEQKGVDSLIVTDLIELARNHAISDAVLISGDEDVRIGVQIAQSFGVRVHLLGIVPSRASQSISLLQEADTTQEWDAGTVGKFLSHKPPIIVVPAPVAQSVSPASSTVDVILDRVAKAVIASMDGNDLAALNTFRQTQKGVPQEFDGKLLGQARTALGRSLDTNERRRVRALFMSSTPRA